MHNPDWLGITSATIELFNNNRVPCGEFFRKKDMEKFGDLILEQEITQVIFSAMCIGWKDLAYYLKKKNPNIKLYSCRMNFFDSKTGEHPLNYKYKKNKIVNILEDYEYPQLSSSSIFIKREVIKNHRYDKTIKYSEDNKFINEIIFEEEKMMMLKKPIYYYRKRAAGTSAIQGSIMKVDWYTITPDKVYKYLFELSKKKYGKVIEYIQYLVGYDISWRLAFNTKMELSKKDKQFYIKTLTWLIKEMDDNIIASHKHLDFAQKYFMLETKNKNIKPLIKYENEEVKIIEHSILKKSLGFVLIDQIYVRDSKGGVFRKGYYIIEVSSLASIFFVERPSNYNSTILLSLRKDIRDIPGLHFYWKNGAEYVTTDFDDYEEVLAKLYQVLPNEYKHLV
jgi:hypothetical protein